MIQRVFLFVGVSVSLVLSWVAVVLLSDWYGPLGQGNAAVAPIEHVVRDAARSSAATLSVPHCNPSIYLAFHTGQPQVRPLTVSPPASEAAVFLELAVGTTPLLLQLIAGVTAVTFVRRRQRHLLRSGYRLPVFGCAAVALVICAPILIVSPTAFWLVVSYFEFASHFAMADHLRAPILNTTDTARMGIVLGLAALYVSLVVMVAQRLAARWARRTGAWTSTCRGCGYALAGGECPECGPVGRSSAARWLWPTARVAGVGVVILALLASPISLGLIDQIRP